MRIMAGKQYLVQSALLGSEFLLSHSRLHRYISLYPPGIPLGYIGYIHCHSSQSENPLFPGFPSHCAAKLVQEVG